MPTDSDTIYELPFSTPFRGHRLEVQAATAQGDRHEQQDTVRVAYDKNGALLVLVIDGMGGEANGRDCAHGVGDAFAGRWHRRPARRSLRRGDGVIDTFEQCFAAAHTAARTTGGGAAVTAAWCDPMEGTCWVAWAGDVIAARLSGDSREAPYAAIHAHRLVGYRNMLTLSVGERGVPAGSAPFSHAEWAFHPGDALLLATDGAWDASAPRWHPRESIEAAFRTNSMRPATEIVADALTAGRVGYRDNATALAVWYRTAPHRPLAREPGQ